MRLLYRHFVQQFTRSEMLSRDSDPRAMAVTAGALLGSPAFVLCAYLGLFANVDDSPEMAFFVALSMLLAALTGLVLWEDLFPGRTDFQVLRPLPLRPAAIATAKLGAIGTILGGMLLLTNAVSVAMLPMVTLPAGPGMLGFARAIAAQATAVIAGSLWAFLAILALRGVTLLVGSEGLSRGMRLGAAVLLLAALVLSPALLAPSLFQVFADTGASKAVLWWVALERWLQGGGGAADAIGALGSLRVLGITAAAAAGVYALGWHRQARMAMAPAARVGHARLPLRRFAETAERLWVSDPRERAVYRFARATLQRSRLHGLYYSLWLGLGAAMVLEGLAAVAWHPHWYTTAEFESMAMAAPLVLCFFLLLGLRYVIALPIELRAQWVFRLAETGGEPRRLDAARKLMFAYAVLPVLGLSLPLSVELWGWDRGAAHVLFCGALAMLLVELLLGRFARLPFTCIHVPGRANFKMLFWLYWIAFTTFAYTSTRLEWTLWRHPVEYGLVLAGLVGGWAAAYQMHRSWRAKLEGCQFDDAPAETLQSLFRREEAVAAGR